MGPKGWTLKDSKDDETKFNETLKRMLESPPKPHNESARPKPSAPKLDQQKKDQKHKRPKARG